MAGEAGGTAVGVAEVKVKVNDVARWVVMGQEGTDLYANHVYVHFLTELEFLKQTPRQIHVFSFIFLFSNLHVNLSIFYIL